VLGEAFLVEPRPASGAGRTALNLGGESMAARVAGRSGISPAVDIGTSLSAASHGAGCDRAASSNQIHGGDS
jgi:hypothetical protein